MSKPKKRSPKAARKTPRAKGLYPKRLLYPKATLQELRDRRDLAVVDGDLKLAFKLAFEIDKVNSGAK